MTRKLRIDRHGITILILLIVLLCYSTFESSGYSSGETAYVLQVHQGVDKHTVYHAEQFKVSLSIRNVYGFEDITDVSINVKIPQEVEFMSSSNEKLDPQIDKDTEEFDFSFGKLPVDGVISLSIIYNVTSEETKSIAITSVNVTYKLENGITGSVLTNTEDIRLSGKKITTTTEELLPIPQGTRDEIDLGLIKIPATPVLSITGYLLPLIFFSISIIFLRRIRYVNA